MQLDRAIKERKSVRKFLSKKPDWRTIIKCIDAVRYAPMAGNIFSLKFILVDDKEKIQQLADAAQQSFIAQTNYVVVVCSDKSRLVNSYGKRGEDYNKQQAGAAIQNFLLKVEDSGLSTCWIGYFVEDMVKRILKIPNDIEVEAMFPIGYEFGKTPRRKKIEIDSFLYFNEYKQKKMNPPKRTMA